MKLTKWDPFREMEGLMGRQDWPFRGGTMTAGEGADWAPRVDISETDTGFTIKADIPGVKREDVKISIEDRVLSIRGESRQEKEDKSEKMHRVERFYGSFSRSFTLPENIDIEKIDASFKDGLLNLVIPKIEVVKPKSVEVEIK
ncbi:MAG: Hsp20/alpha crystallin family protein [Desulfuromonadales bacterium]|nr:Hsp20/alpha crystallin family protein [Desulfuromonadales bacterium]